MHVVRSIKHERPSLQQMARWRNLPGVVHWGLHVVLPRVHGINEGLLSSFVTFVLLSCPRVCLLDVSRLLGLTLRPPAPVCCCHRNSLTRGRLAIVLEAVRVFFFFFSIFSIGSAWHVPGDLRQPSSNVSSSVAEIWRSCSYVNMFLVSPCSSFQVSAPFSTIYSGYAWARSKCVTSWCVECASHHCG